MCLLIFAINCFTGFLIFINFLVGYIIFNFIRKKIMENIKEKYINEKFNDFIIEFQNFSINNKPCSFNKLLRDPRIKIRHNQIKNDVILFYKNHPIVIYPINKLSFYDPERKDHHKEKHCLICPYESIVNCILQRIYKYWFIKAGNSQNPNNYNDHDDILEIDLCPHYHLNPDNKYQFLDIQYINGSNIVIKNDYIPGNVHLSVKTFPWLRNLTSYKIYDVIILQYYKYHHTIYKVHFTYPNKSLKDTYIIYPDNIRKN